MLTFKNKKANTLPIPKIKREKDSLACFQVSIYAKAIIVSDYIITDFVSVFLDPII